MTDQELKDLVAGLSISNAELRKSQQETDKLVRQVTKQLGELGNKFGSFTEGMAWLSLDKLLRKHFGMNDVGQRRRATNNGHSLEIDVLAFDNTGARDEVYLVEIKSRLTDAGIEQMLKTVADFPRFFPQLADRKTYGIIAAVDIPDNLRAEVLKQGLYLARISDETFKLAVPRGFKPKAFGATEARNEHTNGQAKASAKKKKTGKK